jgi:hypothetical protein
MYILNFLFLATSQLNHNLLSMDGALVGVGYGIPKWTYLEAIIVWTLGKFCLVQG